MARFLSRSALGSAAAIALAGFAGGALGPAEAQAPALAMLDGLEKGQWVLRFRDSKSTRNICLRTGQEFIQLRHSDPGCSRYVVEDGADEVTVQYSCAGNGYGRTSVRRETATLVQVESQGIAGGKPFQFTAEARRIGACN